MVQQEVVGLVERRRGRAIKTILGHAEAHLFAAANADTVAAFRKVVLDELNGLTTVALEVFESAAAGGNPINEHWLRLVEEMHDVIVGDSGPPDA